MTQLFCSKAETVDRTTWERAELFAKFGSMSDPFHGVCLRMDCTETFDFAKQNGHSIFLSLLHRALVAAQRVENFRLRVVEGDVLRFTTVHGGSAVGRENGTIGFGHYAYRPVITEFVREASIEVARVKTLNTVESFPGQNVIRFSVLPWFDFTSISHATDAASKDSAPKITFGKITEKDGRRTMPVSVHVHHGLVDGSHVAEFMTEFERCLRHPRG